MTPMKVIAMKSYKRQRALTLIELLIAMSIFSILAVLSYGGLATVLNSNRVIEKESQALAVLQRAFLRIGRDVEQAAPRVIRDAYGEKQPALHNRADSYDGMQTIMELTVAGHRLLPGETRTSLQRVTYILRDDVLLRLTWPVLDRAQDTAPHESILLEGVSELGFRYLNEKGVWLADWPGDGVMDLPRAVELSLVLENWGPLRRIYRVVG